MQNGIDFPFPQAVKGFLLWSDTRTDSCLIDTEPPDVREWFSSYVYESPELSEHSREFVSKESECKKEGPVTGESKKEHDNSGELTKVNNGDVAGAREVPHTNGLVYNGGGSFADQDCENQTLTKVLFCILLCLELGLAWHHPYAFWWNTAYCDHMVNDPRGSSITLTFVPVVSFPLCVSSVVVVQLNMTSKLSIHS